MCVIKENIKFVYSQVILCDSPVAMLDYVDPSQLTYDVGGAIDYDPNEWTQNRAVCCCLFVVVVLLFLKKKSKKIFYCYILIDLLQIKF